MLVDGRCISGYASGVFRLALLKMNVCGDTCCHATGERFPYDVCSYVELGSAGVVDVHGASMGGESDPVGKTR